VNKLVPFAWLLNRALEITITIRPYYKNSFCVSAKTGVQYIVVLVARVLLSMNTENLVFCALGWTQNTSE